MPASTVGVVVGVEHDRQALVVQLDGDGRGRRAVAQHADPPRDVAAEVGDERGEVATGIDGGGAPGPAGEARGHLDVPHDDQQVHARGNLSPTPSLRSRP